MESKSPDDLDQAVLGAHNQYAKDHPSSLRSHQEACKYLPGGNTRTVLYTTPFPLTFVSGKGSTLTTADGHELVDFLGEYTAGIYGHSNPVIRKAIEETLDQGWNLGGHNESERELGRILCNRFLTIERVRFVNSGTEANMMAIATAVTFTGRSKVLIFYKGYHGGTICGGVPGTDPPINLPHDFVRAPYNDIEGTQKIVEDLPCQSLAAILVEPMLGSSGCYVAKENFLAYLQSVSSDLGALLIFDEVMTSRLSYQDMGLTKRFKPDLMTLGKWIGGGMSFGAFGGRADIMDMYDPRLGKLDHPGTFNNNIFSMNAGIAGCELLTQEVLKRLNDTGSAMAREIDRTLSSCGFEIVKPLAPIIDETSISRSQVIPVMYITGAGSLMNIHFSGPNKTQLQTLFWHHMLRHGIYLAQRGFVALSIEITSSDVERFVDAVRIFCQIWFP